MCVGFKRTEKLELRSGKELCKSAREEINFKFGFDKVS